MLEPLDHSTEARKRNQNISVMLRRIRKAVEPWPKAMLFELRDRGYDSVFEELCACVLSIRTLDETSLKTSLRLFAEARTPKQVADLSTTELTDLIFDSTFPKQKATSLHTIAEIYHSKPLPSTFAELVELPGIGPKCANLVRGIALGQPAIGVDIHVHRVTNRWGYVNAPTPEKTLRQLEERLPRKHWVEINELLVPFGKHICTGNSPFCSKCPVAEMCEQVGVERRR